MPSSTNNDDAVDSSPTPLQSLRSHLGSINSLTQREVDLLLARLRARGKQQNEG